ncbi:MAG: RNA methyltransferase [Bacteroidales bacterium]|nr:RNA methyltransferase [Bacteroidales bacterium]
MLSKNKIKFINSLKLRKYREKNRLFLAEGEKIVSDLLSSNLNAEYLIIEEGFNFKVLNKKVEIIRTDSSSIKMISGLKNPSKVMGIFETIQNEFKVSDIINKISLFCDGIQDPGNLGTIIRTADWFGIEHIICTNETVDVYNPKVVQATMGAIAGVKVYYSEAEDFFKQISGDIQVYGTFLEGENIYKSELSESAIIVIGNEGKGISYEVEKYIDKKIYIPCRADGKNFSESLNASVATGIVCSEFVRRKM